MREFVLFLVLLCHAAAVTRKGGVVGLPRGLFDDLEYLENAVGVDRYLLDAKPSVLLLWDGTSDGHGLGFEGSYDVNAPIPSGDSYRVNPRYAGKQSAQMIAPTDTVSVNSDQGGIIRKITCETAFMYQSSGGYYYLGSIEIESYLKSIDNTQKAKISVPTFQPVDTISMLGPIVGFYGSYEQAAFYSIGGYLDVSLWPDRPSRLIRGQMGGSLYSENPGEYFDDTEAMPASVKGMPYMVQIERISVTHDEDYVYGINVTYSYCYAWNDTVRGVEHSHSSPLHSNVNVTTLEFPDGYSIVEVKIAKGSETPSNIDTCLQYMQITVMADESDQTLSYEFGSSTDHVYTYDSVAAFYGIYWPNLGCLRNLGVYSLSKNEDQLNVCFVPDPPTWGKYVAVPTKILAGTVLYIVCDEGYKLVGASPRLTCHRSGRWLYEGETRPFCEKSCPPPPSIDYGVVHNQGPPQSWIVGTVLEVQCFDIYYELEGPQNITCQLDGTWSELPECVMGCLEISDPQNGQLKGPVRSLYKPSEELTVKCNEGYTHLGVSVLACLENGSWSGTIPTCVETPPCVPPAQVLETTTMLITEPSTPIPEVQQVWNNCYFAIIPGVVILACLLVLGVISLTVNICLCVKISHRKEQERGIISLTTEQDEENEQYEDDLNNYSQGADMTVTNPTFTEQTDH